MADMVKERTDMAQDKEEVMDGQKGGVRRGLKEKKEIAYEEDKMVIIEIDGGKLVLALEVLKSIRELCGAIVVCRLLDENRFEVTIASEGAKRKLLEGFKIGAASVHARELCSNEMVVSFLRMPAYITDEVIVAQLSGWGVAAVSEVKRRMWLGTRIADGTRFVRVQFTDIVQSLPYSTKFETANGLEYGRVIHNKQVKVCRGCLQPGHIMRECPDFVCYTGVTEGVKCNLCFNEIDKCMCVESSQESEDEVEGGGAEGTALLMILILPLSPDLSPSSEGEVDMMEVNMMRKRPWECVFDVITCLHRDDEGRLLVVEGVKGGKSYRLINIYVYMRQIR
uniref:CCHC-type domain-containing protein n=1 Tax=Gouania willdenowi TaxID=441366 RepID=A0A8C5GE63_GOUWI